MKAHSSPKVGADEQAALWAARLEGSTLDAGDRVSLDAWLAEDPRHRGLLSGYCQFSADLEVLLPELVAAGRVTAPLPRGRARSPWRFSRIALATGALAAALVFGFWSLRPGVRDEIFASPSGQRQAFALGDGTRVELNARTQLDFSLRGGERHARLIEGEAYFIVSKDKGRPFVVETPSGSVRVTGTTFAVGTGATSLEVTVIEGAVQVMPGVATGARETTSVALGAGDRLVAAESDVTVRRLSREAVDDVLAWRQGMVVFDRERLEVALARFARYLGRSIQVSPAAAKLHAGGRHSLDDLDGFLAAIEEPLGIRVTKEPGGAVRVRLRSE